MSMSMSLFLGFYQSVGYNILVERASKVSYSQNIVNTDFDGNNSEAVKKSNETFVQNG